MKYLVTSFVFICLAASGQKPERPYRGGFVTKDWAEVRSNYDLFYKNLGVKKNENVASVGASCGYIEVQVSALIDSINWTLQDIDTTRLNRANFNKVLRYHEKLKGSPIAGQFKLVVGKISKSNLEKNSYDRVLLINVYHEISDRKSILTEIKESLKPGGSVVIMERMAHKQGQKHGDCKLPKLWEPDFLVEMKNFGFQMSGKIVPVKKFPMVYYTFNQI
ncbi:hypothetical protein WSM22_00480 [Cytophagales bacterium WSM2-2]|nr:hypothetical protein WSM22_00480 [Cytophagales bacterium WSM2-2]